MRVAAVHTLTYILVNNDFVEITRNMRAFWRSLVGHSQPRWVGHEKGVIHHATVAIMNAMWSLYPKIEEKTSLETTG